MPAPPNFRSSGMNRQLIVNAELQVANNAQLLRIFRPETKRGIDLAPSPPLRVSPNSDDTMSGFLVFEVWGRIVRTRRAYKGIESVTPDQTPLAELEWVVALPASTPIKRKDWIVTELGQRLEVIIVSMTDVHPHRTTVVARLIQ